LSILISGARDQCLNNNRKTLDSDDVLTSMSQLGFLDQKDSLSRYLDKYKMTTSQSSSSAAAPLPKEKVKKEQKPSKPKEGKKEGKTTEGKKKYYITKKQRQEMEEAARLAAIQESVQPTDVTTEEHSL